MKALDFFAWCERRSYTDNARLAELFDVSSQTIRNWRKRDEVPYWVELAMKYFDTVGITQDTTSLPDDTFEAFTLWQRGHGLDTYQKTADVFRIKRQAVHQWFSRSRLPRWTKYARRGYDLQITN